MNNILIYTCRLTLTCVFATLIAGCDQIEKVYSGIGEEKSTSETTSTTDTGGSNSADAGQPVAGSTSEPESEDGKTDPEDENDSESEGEKEDPGSEDEFTSSDRNVDQYPRLPGNVTWKPISSSSGGNLTIVLWGNGGGEKNYEQGSLRVEHNDGTKYPTTYVRRDDPDNGERAPKLYFDVQGGWFVGKDPVLFWNLGAYRIVSPEKRQGKNEGKKD